MKIGDGLEGGWELKKNHSEDILFIFKILFPSKNSFSSNTSNAFNFQISSKGMDHKDILK